MAREPFNRVWAENPEQFEQPSNPTWDLGWEGGADKDPPEAKWQNWWQNRVDNALQNIERGGAMEWLSTAPYLKWAKARGSDGNNYQAVQANIGIDPVTDDGANWIIDRTPSPLGYSLTQNGYYSLPGGLIVQWFQHDPGVLANNESFSVVFPTIFPTACLQVFIGGTSGDQQGSVESTEGMDVTSFDQSSVTCSSSWFRFPTATSGGGSGIVRFFAIGF